MAEGLADSTLARQMNVTVSTVEKHATTLFRRLGLNTELCGPTSADNVRVRAVLS
jgi:DNA-binding NarL/FixJ family response regulator